jgi:hypothetical protein
MSRELDDALETEIEKDVSRPFLALHIALPDVVRVWTGTGDIVFEDADGNTQTWIGAGGIGSIDTIGEATDGSAQGIKATLFNIPSEFRDDIADQAVRGVTFEVYVGALNETMQAVVGSSLLWKGRLDDYRITDAGETITVEVTGESRAIDQRRPAIKRFSDEWQKRHHTGDKFFEYVPQMAEVPILWAAASQNATGGAGGGGAGGTGGGGSFVSPSHL